MADQVHVPQEAPGPATEPSGGKGTPQFGLTAAMALIVGSIIGVGVFNLPTSLAAYGPITLISMALTTVGALALAVLFAALSRRLPADGGPYAYARAGFGNPLGFINAWSYWITAWAGNAAIAVGWVLYVEHFINKGHTKWITVLLVLVGLWIPAAVNLSGVKNMGVVTFSLYAVFFSIATRDERRTVFSLDTFADAKFVIATGVSILTLLLTTVFGPLQAFLKTTSLDVRQWLICLAVALSIVVASEVRKAVRRHTVPSHPTTR